MFERNWGNQKNLNVLKRFYKIYTNDFPGASKIRTELMDAKIYEDVYRIVQAELEN